MPNKKQVFFNLSCAFSSDEFIHKPYVNDGEERILQYVEGLNSFFSFFKKYCGNYEDVFITDNTVNTKSQIDKRILEVIPDKVNFCFSYKKSKNKYGRNNKGSGLIESWEYNKKKINKYEYIFHHDGTRAKMLNFNFYNNFLKNPSNTFKDTGGGQFWTGTFIATTKDILDYLKFRSAESLSEENQCIENDLHNFFQEPRDCVLVDEIGVEWNDQFANTVRVQ